MNKLAPVSLLIQPHIITTVRVYWLSTANSGLNAKVQDKLANYEVHEYIHTYIHTDRHLV